MAKIIYGLIFIKLKKIQYKTGIQLACGTNIGKGIFFPHFSCIVINKGVIIGENCTLFHGVTLGSVRGGQKGGSPTLGDNVVVSPGAKVLGKIIVGNNVMIGANAVVIENVPRNAVVVGNPARIINFNGKVHTEQYS